MSLVPNPQDFNEVPTLDLQIAPRYFWYSADFGDLILPQDLLRNGSNNDWLLFFIKCICEQNFI